MPASRTGPSPRLYKLAALANVAIALALVIAALVGSHGLTRHAKLRDELSRVQDLNEQLQHENKRLKNEAAALRSDPDYIEWVIRDEFGWAKSDELLFIFPAEPRPRDKAADEEGRRR